MNKISKLSKIIYATRPKTLIASLAPIMMGAALGRYRSGDFQWVYIFAVFIAAALIQVATNFYNDAIDGFEKRDTEKRLGPARFSGSDPSFLNLLKKLALGCLFVALLLGLFVAYRGGPLVLLTGLPALFLAYLYTGTKYSLSANGWADGFVVFYFGVLPVWVLELVLVQKPGLLSLLMGLQCGLLCNVLLIINNLRDHEEDSSTGKKTLIVRFGRKFGLYFLAVFLFSPYLINFFWLYTRFFRAGLWTFTLLPMAIYIFNKVIKTKPSKVYNFILGLSSLHLFIFSLVFSLGVLSS